MRFNLVKQAPQFKSVEKILFISWTMISDMTILAFSIILCFGEVGEVATMSVPMSDKFCHISSVDMILECAEEQPLTFFLPVTQMFGINDYTFT